MKQIVTKGIVLSRTDYGESDRILNVLTPDNGKISLMAKGTRKIKSKLAGGIELFCLSDITFLVGKGDMGNLISSRLITYYGNIVTDLDRVQLGYKLIKMLNRATEAHTEEGYFELLDKSFEALNNLELDIDLILFWFEAQLLKLSGHSPNLKYDQAEKKLLEDVSYNFDYENMSFVSSAEGKFNSKHIKTLRLLFSNNLPKEISKVNNLLTTIKDVSPIITTSLSTYIRL